MKTYTVLKQNKSIKQGDGHMIQRIKINMDAIEAMLYFWQATSEKENVSEQFFYDVAEFKGMKETYRDDFNGESVRKVLSAIKNRELLSDATLPEKRFWNNNMWMMEDLEYTNFMVQPLKKLNLDELAKKLNEKFPNSKVDELEVIFAPLHVDEHYIKNNMLIINFFRTKPSDFDDSVFIGEMELTSFIEEKLCEILSK